MKKKLSVMMVIVFLMFSQTVLASDWSFYGSARVSTFWTDSDLADETQFEETLQSNARIGAMVKVSDELCGQFEYGASDGNANIRYLYGEWDFGPGTLLVGQYETPLYLPVSNQVYNADNGLEGWGEASPGRHSQVRLSWNGLKVAIVETTADYYNAATSTIENDNTEQVIPRLEASYTLSLENLTMALGGGYSTFEYDGREDVDAYVGTVCAIYHYQGFRVGAQAFAGQNVGNIITLDTTGNDDGKGYAKVEAGQVVDNDAMGFEVVAGYTFSDVISMEAGYGYMQSEFDDADDDKICAYYLQVPLTLAPGVVIVPEAGMIDYDEEGQDEVTYVGAKWQINF